MAKYEERWMDLCAQAAVEQDPEKLIQLIEEITRLLEERETRVRRQHDKGKT